MSFEFRIFDLDKFTRENFIIIDTLKNFLQEHVCFILY